MLDALEALYKKYGYFAESQVSIVLKGKEGQERIGRIMDMFRNEKPMKYGDFIVAEVIDFIGGYEDIPPQNALKVIMTDGSWFAMRPSGTEPKIKSYYYTVTDNKEDSQACVAALAKAVGAMAESVK